MGTGKYDRLIVKTGKGHGLDHVLFSVLSPFLLIDKAPEKCYHYCMVSENANRPHPFLFG